MKRIHKFIAFLLAFMLTFSSTVIPLKTSMVYALDTNGEEVTEYESIMTSDTADDPEIDTSNETLPVEDTDINEPETTTPEDISSPLDKMDQTPIVNPLLAEANEEIVEQTIYASLYEDTSYEDIALENTIIAITGLMPAHATVKAYKTNDEIEGKETMFAFTFEIFDKEDKLWQSEMPGYYQISISHRDLVDKENVYLYERPANTTRYFERRDFDRYTDSVEFEAGLSEFIIATDLPRESEDETLSDSIDEENTSATPENNLIISPTDIITNLIETPEKDETDTDPSEVDTTETDELDWRADLLNPTDEKDGAENIDSKEKSEVEEAHGENITDEANDLKESENESTEDTDLSPEEVDSAKDINLTDKTNELEDLEDQSVEEGENKLSYQQVLADIYTDSSYTMRSYDPTRIKLSGKLPGYTKIKAYPVDIEIENQKVLAAYDIKIFDKDNKEYEVSAANDIRVEITNQKISEADKVEIYHKENEFAPEEKIEIQDKTNDTVTFKADSFSIYAVTDPDARAITFVFLNRNENNEREVWDTQTVRNGEKLIQPELPIFSYKGKFEGWHYYDIETDTFGEEFDFDKPVTVTDSSPKTIYLKGKYPDVAYINFIDRKEVENSNGSISYVDEVLSTKEIPLGGMVTTEDVPVIPGESGTVFSHWALKPDSTEAFDFNTPITKEYIQRVQGADNYVRLDLYAVFKKALTVTFDSQGGTHVNKQVVYSGDRLSLNDLTKPVRPGYDFKYWSTKPNGSKFNANTPITKDMTLYAVWTPQVVKYTINHFMENADDNGYSLYSSETRTANAGTYTNADSSSYKLPSSTMKNEKIHYVGADTSKIIRGDGTTEINLYYDRDTFKLRIYEQPFLTQYNVVVADVKWGADTKPYFDQALAKLGSGYTFKENGLAGQTVTTPPRMPKKDYTLMAWREGNNAWNVRIIDIDTNELIRLDQKTSQLPSSFQGYTGGEDITGYTYRYVERPGNNFARPSTNHDNGKTSDINEVWVYYSRNSHDLTFSTNGNGPDIVRKGVLYQSSLAKYAPENYIIGQTKNSDGKIFAGWFDNPNGAGNPLDLKSMTMPDNNLKLYAKWEEPVYTVRAYRQRNNPEAGVIELKVKRGDTVDSTKLSADKPPVAQQTPGSELRWYAFINGTLTEYNFSDPVYSDLFLYPVWLAPVGDEFRPLSQIYRVKYKAPQEDGTDYVYTDPNDYVNNAEAIVIPPYINNDYRFPPDKDNPSGKKLSVPKDKVFEGWVIDKDSEFTSVTDQTMLNKIYQPGDIVNVIGNIMFKPVFNEYRVTTLTLKEIAPGGSPLDDIVYETRNKPSDLPNGINDNRPTEDLRNNDTITLPQPSATNTTGFHFIGWSTTEDPTKGEIFEPGQEVMITYENMPNILYGIWERNKFKVTIINNLTGDDITDNDKKFIVSYTLEDTNYSKEYEVDNGNSIDVEIPYGSTNIKIEAKSNRYVKYTYKGDTYNSNTLSLESIEEDIKVIFESQPLPPPTGIIENIIPMVTLIIIAITALAGFVIYKKKKLGGTID